MTTVNITTELFEEDEDMTYWNMTFLFTAGDLKYRFDVSEPYTESKADWLALAEGKISIYLYSGNGEGSICLCKENDGLEFTGAPSGSGGDVSSSIVIPRLLVTDKLKAIIEEADRLGYTFADHK